MKKVKKVAIIVAAIVLLWGYASIRHEVNKADLARSASRYNYSSSSLIKATATPTRKPTVTPTRKPTTRPTVTPTRKPTTKPTLTPKSVGRAGVGNTSKQFRLSLNATCGYYNHVGNEWSFQYYVDGKRVYNNTTITLRSGQTIEVKAVITEDEKYPDVGYATFRHTITEAELTKGFSASFDVRVTEDRGQYRGNSCTWRVTFRFNI